MSALPALAPAPAAALSQKDKASVIVGLLDEVEPGMLSELIDGKLREDLAGHRARLGVLPPEAIAAVVEEFLEALSPGPPQTTPVAPGFDPLPALGGDLPVFGDVPHPEEAGTAPDPWARVALQDDEWLARRLRAEAPEVGAVILSQLKVSRGAELLGLIPGPEARAIAYAVSRIGAVTPDVVALIGETLVDSLGDAPARAYTDGPVERLGALLNSARAATRDDVLAALTDEDPDFAEAVRKSIFTFANIPTRIDPRDIPKIVRELDSETLSRAIKAATGDARHEASAEFLLAGLSQRMAEAIRDEIEEMPPLKGDEGELAMAEVVARIREMDEAGEIYFLAGDG